LPIANGIVFLKGKDSIDPRDKFPTH